MNAPQGEARLLGPFSHYNSATIPTRCRYKHIASREGSRQTSFTITNPTSSLSLPFLFCSIYYCFLHTTHLFNWNPFFLLSLPCLIFLFPIAYILFFILLFICLNGPFLYSYFLILYIVQSFSWERSRTRNASRSLGQCYSPACPGNP